MVICREASRGRKDTLGGTPMGTLLDLNPEGTWREKGIGPEGEINKAHSSRASHSHVGSSPWKSKG